jgi:hypothetical protein
LQPGERIPYVLEFVALLTFWIAHKIKKRPQDNSRFYPPCALLGVALKFKRLRDRFWLDAKSKKYVD